jgi:ribosomal protein S12 methylthiotransferase
MDSEGRFMLPELLNAAAKASTVPWLRLLYAHPGHVSEGIIDAIAAHPNICKYVDFPIEHSHDAMLKRMNRGVDRKKMEWGMKEMRKRIPGVAIRTTVIVGFPGETEAEFEDLLNFMKEYRFERLGAFKFSNEREAKAFAMPDHISEELKEERFRRVMELQRDISAEINQGFVGKTMRVLIDEKHSELKDAYRGRTQMDAPEVDGEVEVHSKKALKPGDFVDVTITDAMEYDLVGNAA